MRGDLPGHTCRRDDDAFAKTGEQLAVDPWLRVEAFGVCQRGELHQVAIPGEVPGEQNQVIVRLLSVAVRTDACPAISGGDVRLHTDDRLELCLAGLLLEFPSGVQ